MKENQIQKEFRMAMNDLLATNPQKEHVFEEKNFYKDYPCECGATDTITGKTCWRYKANRIKVRFYEYLTTEIKT